MKLAGWTTLLYGALLLATGWMGCITDGFLSPVLGTILGVGFLLLGRAYLRGKAAAGYLSAAGILLMAIYFAYRFLATERFVPAGLLLIVSFVFLFLVLLGFFISLAQNSEQGPL